MMDLIFAKLTDQQFLVGLLVMIAAAATVVTVSMPLLETDTLGRRMKSMATERERIRARERERLSRAGKGSLRPEAKAFMSRIVTGFSASKMAGHRKGQSSARHGGLSRAAGRDRLPVLPPGGAGRLSRGHRRSMCSSSSTSACPSVLKVGIVICSAYLGIKAPEIFLSNTISKRQKSLRRAFPDTLDLMLICVESGMSLEHACRKVSQEIGQQSIPMAEELTLTTAELSYLSDRRQAFENLSNRTGRREHPRARHGADPIGALRHAARRGACGSCRRKAATRA